MLKIQFRLQPIKCEITTILKKLVRLKAGEAMPNILFNNRLQKTKKKKVIYESNTWWALSNNSLIHHCIACITDIVKQGLV